MNFKYQRTVFIQANMETVWTALIDQQFERDFLPEISCRHSAKPVLSEMNAARSISWEAGADVNIELTRKDLNVKINAVQISLKPRSGGVDATIFVAYSKRLEKYFVKAHRAIRQLFSIKLDVLKSDCIADEPDYLLSVVCIPGVRC